MKKLICTSLIVLAVASADAANYTPGFYARIEGGASIMYNSTARTQVGTLPAFGLAAGYKFNDMFRSEFNIRYRQVNFKDHDGTKGSLRETPVLLNAYFDIHNQSVFTPYLTAGFGTAIYTGSVDLSDSKAQRALEADSNSATFPLFAWNAGLGTRYQVTKNIDLDLSYRFIDVLPMINGLFSSHNITLGLIYNF